MAQAMNNLNKAETGAIKAIRGELLDFKGVVSHPEQLPENVRHIEDGLLLVQEGRIKWRGSWEEGKELIPADAQVFDYRGKFIMPGFIDTHVHFPQLEIIGSYGEQLLEWLNTYTFPTELKYSKKEYAREMAGIFLKELLRNGTTTALTFCTVHPQSAEALFEEADRLNMRLIAGKVMMDRHAPEGLLDTPETAYSESKALIEKWHNHNRLSYVLLPRFAPTSTPEQLEQIMHLKEEYPDCYLQTHLAENLNECAWVKDLFPEQRSYLDVYHHYKLTGRRSTFAHCIHLDEEDYKCMEETESGIAFCPTSNMFLGSGLFPLRQAQASNVRVGLATDVGAGTSFSMLQTLNEAYKVMQLQGEKLPPFEGFYLATMGSAHSLDLDDRVGNFDEGKEADFIVLDPAATSLQQLRRDNSHTLEEQLFVLMTLGDDRNIYRTWVNGTPVHERN